MNGSEQIWRVIGRLEAHQKMTAEQGSDHRKRDYRLETRVAQMSDELSELEQRLKTLEQRPGRSGASRAIPIETIVKWGATIALPLLTLWMTGSTQQAVAVLERLKGAH